MGLLGLADLHAGSKFNKTIFLKIIKQGVTEQVM